MRKFLFSSALLTMTALMICLQPASAQTRGIAQYEITNPNVITSGSFSQPVTYAPVSAGATGQIFPWYTSLDTVTNTGADTFNQKISGEYNSVFTWAHVNSISGTNTSCTVILYASADSNKGVDWTAIYTVTVTATNPFGTLINSGIGWPYTNLRWIFTGVGTQKSSWKCGLLVRYFEIPEMLDNRQRHGWVDDNYVLE